MSMPFVIASGAATTVISTSNILAAGNNHGYVPISFEIAYIITMIGIVVGTIIFCIKYK